MDQKRYGNAVIAIGDRYRLKADSAGLNWELLEWRKPTGNGRKSDEEGWFPMGVFFQTLGNALAYVVRRELMGQEGLMELGEAIARISEIPTACCPFGSRTLQRSRDRREQGRKGSEDMAFDLSRFGITELPKVARGRTTKSYLVKTSNKNSSGLVLHLSAAARREVTDRFGEYVKVGYDKKGRVFLYQGDKLDRKVSAKSKTDDGGSVSVGSMYNGYKEIMGMFSRLYLDFDLYAGGEAVVFTPDGYVIR